MAATINPEHDNVDHRVLQFFPHFLEHHCWVVEIRRQEVLHGLVELQVAWGILEDVELAGSLLVHQAHVQPVDEAWVFQDPRYGSGLLDLSLGARVFGVRAIAPDIFLRVFGYAAPGSDNLPVEKDPEVVQTEEQRVG